MPVATHPQAKFDPLPPDLDLQGLVDRTPNFEFAQRIPASKIRRLEFEKLVWYQVIKQGKPLVIEGWQSKLPKSLFSPQFLEANYNKKQENVRDINAQANMPMTMGHYLRSMRQLADQWTPTNFRDERRQRLYLKDIDCPPEWYEYLRKIMPPGLFYWNENVEEHGGPRDDNLFMDEKTVAPAGDLMSNLPEDMRAQNLMCYIGHEGTYTPAHREMCASLGQNIMVEASANENGEKEGSSIWFMTETKDREVVREYFLSMLGHDVEIEKHFAQVNAWKKANFPVYIVEQKVGDFILIPPLAPHQVWNRGTRTMKVAWNRTTVETLDFALHEALPRARLVCRDEQYKNKAIVYFSLKKYYDMLKTTADSQMAWLMGEEAGKDSARLTQLKKDFKKLLQLFTEVLVDEVFAHKEKNVEMIPFDSCITCSYCRSNIFNRFLTCPHCVRELVGGIQDTYDICMECYAMGRSCLCVSGLTFCEQWDWSELTDNYDAWRSMVIYNDGFVDVDSSPPPLEIARMRIGRKSLAQICQEQLGRRPFHDITKPDKEPSLEPEEPVVIDKNGNVKKPKRKKKKGDVYKCHTCVHKDYTYRLAFCSNPGCNQAYCFGVLYRAFDMMPQEVLQAEWWQCPKCQGICNCGSCRRTGNTIPYEPKNTYIGHDTRAVADDRSQEILVDFRVHNLNWLKAAGDESRNHNSKRIQRLRQEADAEKDKDQDVAGALADRAQQNGFADQTQAAGVEGPVDSDEAPVQQPPQHDDDGLHQLPDPNASLYPEEMTYPVTPVAERRLGIGYYEQDDAPDKILFDHYEEPTEEPTFDEESEFVKKSLRAAKRRAKQEDDNDPDFIAGRSHKRKKRLDRAPASNALQNVDPALLSGGDMSMVDAPPSESLAPEPQGNDNPENQQVVDQEQEQTQALDQDLGRPFDPNVPTLRPTRPKVSYADVDDIEEFNDILPIKPKKAVAVPQPAADAGASTDPLDLAAEAMRAITDTPASQTPQPQKKGPGRPPGRGRPRKSDAASRSSPEAAKSNTSSPQTGSGKRRGRPPRSSLAINSISIDADESDLAQDATIDELGRDLVRELQDGEDTFREPSSASASATASASVAAPVSAPASAPAPAPKRRGRPPKSQTTVAAPASDNSTPTRSTRATTTTAATSEKFMSIAERMALRGKKVKIGQRKSLRAAAESSNEQHRTAEPSDVMNAKMGDDEPREEPQAEQEPESRPEATQEREGSMQTDVDGDNSGYAPLYSPAASDDGSFNEPPPPESTEPASSVEEPESVRQVSSGPVSKASSIAPSRSRVPSATLPSGATVIMKESRDPSTDPEFESREPSPLPLPPKSTGPTVVRIGDSGDEGDYNYYSGDSFSGSELGQSVDDDEDDDDDIPAEPVANAMPRGRMAKRGGGIRGRGRGRGRGRA